MEKTTPLFLQALSGAVTKTAPIWLMRQAGRYLPEYREVRKKAGSFLNLCFSPELAAEVTLQPIRRFDFDAAIIFSDILVIPYALGQGLSFIEGEGPQLEPLKNFQELGFKNFEKKLLPGYEALRLTKAGLSRDKALIGFAGAPWTLACYMINSRGDGEFKKAVEYMREKKSEFSILIDLLCEAVAQHLIFQLRNGADAVQIFDSWAGLLSGDEFDLWVTAPAQKIVSRVREKIPGALIIGFPRQAGEKYVSYAKQTGVSAIGLDPVANLAQFSAKTCLQGNLSPESLLAGGDVMRLETERILNNTRNRPFIFNLGHGVIKETPPDNVAALVKIVRDFKR